MTNTDDVLMPSFSSLSSLVQESPRQKTKPNSTHRLLKTEVY
jgi:hypothetical protein